MNAMAHADAQMPSATVVNFCSAINFPILSPRKMNRRQNS
jgi:hypothetical protein